MAGRRTTRCPGVWKNFNCTHSTLYSARLGAQPPVLHSLEDLANLPFTTADDVRQWQRLLCVSQGYVQRMVTVQTSGTTGPPKRLAFSAHDLQRTREFFQLGMGQLVRPGQRLLVLLPGGQRPHGVADLLRQALPLVDVQALSCEPAPESLRRMVTELAAFTQGEAQGAHWSAVFPVPCWIIMA